MGTNQLTQSAHSASLPPDRMRAIQPTSSLPAGYGRRVVGLSPIVGEHRAIRISFAGQDYFPAGYDRIDAHPQAVSVRRKCLAFPVKHGGPALGVSCCELAAIREYRTVSKVMACRARSACRGRSACQGRSACRGRVWWPADWRADLLVGRVVQQGFWPLRQWRLRRSLRR